MEPRSLGLVVVIAGVVIILLGVLIMSGAMGWFGRLPGDIRIEGEGSRVYIPLVSMLILSIVLSLLLAIFRRFF